MPRGIKPHVDYATLPDAAISTEELKQSIAKAIVDIASSFDASSAIRNSFDTAFNPGMSGSPPMLGSFGDRGVTFAPSVSTPGTYKIVGVTTASSTSNISYDPPTYSNYNKYTDELHTQVQTRRQAGIFIENTINERIYVQGDYKHQLIRLVNSRLISQFRDTSFHQGVIDGRNMGLEWCTGIREFSYDRSSNRPTLNLCADLTCVSDFRDTMKMAVEYYDLYKNNRTIKSIRRYFYGVYFALVQVAKATIAMRVENYDTLPIEVQDWVMLTLTDELHVAFKLESLVEVLGRLYELYILSKTANMFPS